MEGRGWDVSGQARMRTPVREEGGQADPGSFFSTSSFPVPPVGDTTRPSHPLLAVERRGTLGRTILCIEQKRRRKGRIDSWIEPGQTAEREERIGSYVDCAKRDVTIVSARNSSVTKHKLSLSRAFTSAKTQLNHVKRNLPRADSKNILTFSGKCWCCHCNAVLLCLFCWGAWCHCLQAAGSGLCCLFCPPGGSQQTLPVLAGSSVLSTCLCDAANPVFPRACAVRLFLPCLWLPLASQCAPKNPRYVFSPSFWVVSFIIY